MRRVKTRLLLLLVALAVVFTSGSPAILPSVAAQVSEEDYFYADDKQVPIQIPLDQIAVVGQEDVTADEMAGLAAQYGFKLLEEYAEGFFILGLPEPHDRATLLQMALKFKQEHPDTVTQAGLVIVPPQAEQPMIAGDEFIAEFSPQVSRDEIDHYNASNGVHILMENPYVRNQFLLQISDPSAVDLIAVANQYHESGKTLYAHPNFIIPIDLRESLLDDPLLANQWHHRNSGASGGTVDADVDTTWAWDITRGSSSVVIAVIDSGFDAAHPDLAPNLWRNSGETADGVDNDGDGLVDDISGWDFNDGDNNLAGHPHGTAAAGLAAARGNNSRGVSGTCPNCRLMLLRGGATAMGTGLAFDYARQKGADIISNSWGYRIGTPIPTNVSRAIRNAATNGRRGLGSVVLFAMNNRNRDDCRGPFPDISSLPTVIAVSNSSNQDRKVTESAFGNCMDILSTGHRGYGGVPFSGTLNVTTTDITGSAGYNSASPSPSIPCVSAEPTNLSYTNCFGGTSAATPIAAGTAGLILSVNPSLNRVQVQRLLQDTGDKTQDSVGRYSTITGFSSPPGGIASHGWGRINAFEAVRVAASHSGGGRDSVDVFIRDNRLDWGNTSGYQGEQPSNTLFEPTRGVIGHHRSVDIKIDHPPYQPAPTTSAAFDAFADEHPQGGELNRVYVRVRNRGSLTASSVTVKLHYAFAGTGLPRLPADFWSSFPADSSDTSRIVPLGVATISNLAYSGSSVAGCPGRTQPACSGATDNAQIVAFDFLAPEFDPSLPNPNHYCLLAIIDSPQDPVDPQSTTRFWLDSITPNDNNITHRNVRLEDTSTRSSFVESFYVRNPTDQPIQSVLRLMNPEALDGWSIELDKLGFEQPFWLKPDQEVLVKAKITLPDVGVSGEVTILQERIDEDVPHLMGGMTYEFRVPSK